MKGIVLGLVIATTSAATCCNPPQHEMFEKQQEMDAKTAALCEARGGVPITDVRTDSESHAFTVLKSCSFPCGDVKLKGEGQ